MLVETEISQNLKNTGENEVFWSKVESTWRQNMQNTLQNQWKMMDFVIMRGRPTGIPWPARGGGKKWVPPGGHGLAWLRPASAGKKTDSREAGIRFFPAP